MISARPLLRFSLVCYPRKKELALTAVNQSLLDTLPPDAVDAVIHRAEEAEGDEMWSYRSCQDNPGKRNTQQIERKHLTLRTRIKRLTRKTICFSRSIRMHDIVIGLFVNRYEFGLLG
jgi:hypothetical protein